MARWAGHAARMGRQEVYTEFWSKTYCRAVTWKTKKATAGRIMDVWDRRTELAQSRLSTVGIQLQRHRTFGFSSRLKFPGITINSKRRKMGAASSLLTRYSYLQTPWKSVIWLPSTVPLGECRGYASLGHDSFLSDPFQFIFHLSPFHWTLYRLIVSCWRSVVK